MPAWTPVHYYGRVFDALPPSVQAEGRIDWLHPRLAVLHEDMLPVAAKRLRRIQSLRPELPIPIPAEDLLVLPSDLVLRINPIHLTDAGGNLVPYGNATAQCPGCKIWKHPAVLVDVRTLPASLTEGQKFACDGCWNSWILKGRLLNGHKLSRRLWIEALGAPQSFLDKVDALPDQSKIGWLWTRPDVSGREKRYLQ